ncbi:MAG: glycosyltransferase family 4 protein [Spirulina sp.]
MKEDDTLRVAWLLPTMSAGAHWQPLVQSFTGKFKNSIFFTTKVWPEFDRSADYSKSVRIVGKFKLIPTNQNSSGYQRGVMLLPLSIIYFLSQYKPDYVITSAFSLWSFLIALAKPIFKWKIITLYEGSTFNADFSDSFIRSSARKLISKFTDQFIANNSSAVKYLEEFLKIDKKMIAPITYLLPDKDLMLAEKNSKSIEIKKQNQLIFLYVGQIIYRKGIDKLLESCNLLKDSGVVDYTVLIIGDGQQAEDFKELATFYDLDGQILWLGRINYGELGYWLELADVFVFPSLEDTWGMAVLEAMSFGKAILCSKFVGASEMVVEDQNGFLFNPNKPQELADLMLKLIEFPDISKRLGTKSLAYMNSHSLDSVTEALHRLLHKI